METRQREKVDVFLTNNNPPRFVSELAGLAHNVYKHSKNALNICVYRRSVRYTDSLCLIIHQLNINVQNITMSHFSGRDQVKK